VLCVCVCDSQGDILSPDEVRAQWKLMTQNYIERRLVDLKNSPLIGDPYIT
jgi:hypothetical protein